MCAFLSFHISHMMDAQALCLMELQASSHPLMKLLYCCVAAPIRLDIIVAVKWQDWNRCSLVSVEPLLHRTQC
jgi:hypothetical protein